MATPPTQIDFAATKCGALVGSFTDRFGAICSIQESSYQEEDCVWLGVEVTSTGEDLPNGRMHVTRAIARQLAQVLFHFAEEGRLGVYDDAVYQVGRWVRGIGKDNHGLIGRVVEARVGSLLSVRVNDMPETWSCVWAMAPSRWIPTEAPPPGRSLFEHLEDG